MRLTAKGGVTDEQAVALQDSLREHVLCGEKFTVLYATDEIDVPGLIETLKAVPIPTSPMEEAYPANISDDLLTGQPAGLQVVAKEEFDDGYAMVFGSVRTIRSRETLEADDLPEDALSLFERFDEIIGMKIARVQGFDVIWIPKKGNHIELRVDYPRGMQHDMALGVHLGLVSQLEALTGVRLVSRVNLFPLLDRMYFDSSEGIVVELGFGTTTASVKNEKMRLKKLSLRDEKYHKAGTAGLGTKIMPFRLSISWRVPFAGVTSMPELSLHSHSRAAGSDSPSLTGGLIQRCIGISDYDFVLSRMKHHLTRSAASEETA